MTSPVDRVGSVLRGAGAVRRGAQTVSVLARAGLIAPMPPRTLAGVARAARRWDRTLAGTSAANAVRRPGAEALIDERGTLTYGELHARSSALANALAARGQGAGSGIGLLCRDHRHFVETVLACSKLGGRLLLLNTSFSGPQLQDVLAREGADVLVHDAEFDVIAEGAGVPRIVGWTDGAATAETVEDLVASAPDTEPEPPAEAGRVIILTSGTTGTPKGARRAPTTPTDAIVGFLERMPVRSDATHVIVAPLFHSWGFAHMGLSLMLGCRIVLRRRFDPEATLRLMSEHRARLVALVPVMAQRILELPEDVRARHRCPALEIAAFGGSAIPGDLAIRFMDAFGDVVYNTYGSTEVAVVTIATPADLRAAPHTAGRPVERVVVRLLDDRGRPVPDGEAGRIFVGSSAAFEGYTGGGSKEVVGELMATGDVGRFDGAGRLAIEGRDDDMIVSGGENVFPREVEDLLSGLDGVREVAVVGVPDDEFGQRLRAVVARADGAELTADDVRNAVRERLARDKVPRDVLFVDELPRTATGKVLKRALADLPPAPAGPAR
jgi:fatty-acyl-CoA synthase